MDQQNTEEQKVKISDITFLLAVVSVLQFLLVPFMAIGILLCIYFGIIGYCVLAILVIGYVSACHVTMRTCLQLNGRMNKEEENEEE